LKVIVSLNRYERKKNLDLAVQSFVSFLDIKKKNGDKDRSEYILIIAGGYDISLNENKEVMERLMSYDYKDFKNQVFFLKNITNDERSIILKTANVVLYTPKNEHFGIVPVESMYCGAYVIAHKSGGPTESVKVGLTGYLMDNEDGDEWAKKLNEFFKIKKNFNHENNMNSQEFKKELKEHVNDKFSLFTMVKDFEKIVLETIPSLRKSKNN